MANSTVNPLFYLFFQESCLEENREMTRKIITFFELDLNVAQQNHLSWLIYIWEKRYRGGHEISVPNANLFQQTSAFLFISCGSVEHFFYVS